MNGFKRMNNTTRLPVEPKYSKEQELYARIESLIHEYNGELSLVATIGILELAKIHVMECAK